MARPRQGHQDKIVELCKRGMDGITLLALMRTLGYGDAFPDLQDCIRRGRLIEVAYRLPNESAEMSFLVPGGSSVEIREG